MSMDLNKNNAYFFSDSDRSRNDTTLRLDCFGYGGNERAGYGVGGMERGNHDMQKNVVDDGCKLVLGLGPTPTVYSDDYHPIGGNKNKGLLSERDSVLKLGFSGRTDEISGLLEFAATTQSNFGQPHHLDQLFSDVDRVVVPIADEGSTSAKKSGGYMPSLLLAPRMENSSNLSLQTSERLEMSAKSHCHVPELSSEPSAISDYSRGNVSEQTSAAISSDRKTSNLKRCEFVGCSKGARGATGLCIGHGGGQRCLKPGCEKGAESRTIYCKAHGGGKRCQHLGCTKSAEGRTDFCIAHGGGNRCGFPGGCTKAARGKSGLCIRHGGGKRCRVEGCARSAEGQVGLCISHGGGRRCKFPNCSKGAQGSTLFCKAHGGGKRCVFSGCTKGAEGATPLCKAHGGGKRCLFDGGGICSKSVHGGTNFCVAHGGGKRCVVPGCTKSARGRTDSCVKHGGGKRCKFENCGKSAQSCTDFCKAHGGGKRCSWGDGKCVKFARGKGGLCAAHCTMVHGKETNKGMIGPGLFQGLVPDASTRTLSSLLSTDSDSIHSLEKNPFKKQQRIPPQVLVPLSSSLLSTKSDSIHSLEKPAKRQQRMPPQVLVPVSSSLLSIDSSSIQSLEKRDKSQQRLPPQLLVPFSMKVSSTSSSPLVEKNDTNKGFDFVIPEGRVHGGGLMSLLGGDLRNAMI